ncbi:MAG TPA: methionine adenosyltransferase [Candidatus Limnocylindrales bacterium]|nr:methionine adenosyltransferase [Candidatus Limnocylindrales bacterium]
MSVDEFIFTSESVSEGHPDKVCDQISDAVLDAHLAGDPHSRVACETLVATDLVVMAGEITSKHEVDYEKIARSVIADIGYIDTDGFKADTAEVMMRLVAQSPDISQGVTVGQGLHEEQGAGDQGLMFGYACDQTTELMPLPISLSHRLVARLAELRHSGKLAYLRPDAKSQVSIQYRDGRPARVATVVISTQHKESATLEQITADVREHVIKPIIPPELLDSDTVYHVNPTGRFVVGGPSGDSGLTGRKIIVDTYGGWGRHGGGAFSGKDPSKVDRSAAYMARYLAKNVVAAGAASACEVQLAYAIGVAQPVSVHVDTFGTSRQDPASIAQKLRNEVDLRPASIIERFKLKRPIYRKTAAYGHFGRPAVDGFFPWENLDLAAKLG